jgi:hypothetical protein
MSDKKYSENDPERTLITLDQLSQTIEVMTSVVNRLRQHLSQQISVKKEHEERQRQNRDEPDAAIEKYRSNRKKMVVEVSQPETDAEEPASEKTLH